MEYAILGRTGVRVSRLCLGTATFGVAPLAADASALIHRALDLGINFFDTANSYGNQTRFDRPGVPPAPQRRWAEEMLGEALKGRRHEVIIASKVQEQIGDGPNDGGQKGGGLSRVHIMRQIDQTLRRLQTDYIDVYYMHHPDPITPIDQTLRAFDDLIHAGKVRYGAFSTFPTWKMIEGLWVADRLGLHAPVCHQVAYNLAWRNAPMPIEREVQPACLQYGLSMTVFSLLGGGLLTGIDTLSRSHTGAQRWGGRGFTPEQIQAGEDLDALAKRWGQSPAQLALAWLIARPAVAAAIIGPETIGELEASVPAADLKLTPEQMAEVDAIGQGT